MNATMSTDLRLQQSQILAPQLQQSLKLLQLPALELQMLLAQHLSTNPTLEQYDPERDTVDDDDTASFDPDAQDRGEVREEQSQSLAEEGHALEEHTTGSGSEEVCEKELDNLVRQDAEWDDYYEAPNEAGDFAPRAEEVSYHERRSDEDERYAFRVQSIPADQNLGDDLRAQFSSMTLTPDEEAVAEYILGSLDGSGFLREPMEEIATALGKDRAVVDKVVALLKSFDPPGIGAKDLQECLLIQLDRRGTRDSVAWRILRDCYQDLLHRRFDRITSALSIGVEEFQAAVREIGSLDPKPGRDLSTGTAPAIRPDIIVTRTEAGTFTVESNDNLLPYVRVSPRIKAMLKSKAIERKQAQYLRQQIREGEMLLNNLQFRKRTVVAVAEAIVEAQKEFFNEGPMFLKPMSMREIAEKVGVHEATVSRTVNQKYMDTPQGVHEMRYFFSSHVTDEQGHEVSTNAVKAKLKELIEAEDQHHPYSDDALAEMLRKDGFPVARRTVVKYRQMLDISNARQRKALM